MICFIRPSRSNLKGNMTGNRYMIGSGYCHKHGEGEWAEWFYRLWMPNTDLAEPEYIVVLANNDSVPPEIETQSSLREMSFCGNLGHVHDLLGKSDTPRPHAYCGWSGIMLTLALMAYNMECDYIFKEQDCLAFGPWVDRLYAELGDGGMIFGKSSQMPVAQSLFLVKHRTIPSFVREYLLQLNDRLVESLPEAKFANMRLHHPDQIKQFSFGYDRDRPINYDDPVFYAQKWTPAELMEIERRGLISLPTGMPQVKAFTGTTDL